MGFLFDTANDSYERARVAPENNRRALILMGEQFFIREDIGAPFVEMAAPKHDLAEQVSCHPVYPIKLGLIPTKWTCVWVLLEPMRLAITTKRFFTSFAFDGVLKHVVANSTNEFG